MENIKDTVKNIMQVLKTRKKELSEEALQVPLKKFLTAKERKHIKLNWVRNGVLGISVDSSTWLYHFSLKKERLLVELGKKAHIRDIRLRIGG